jgi:hypothetical protein
VRFRRYFLRLSISSLPAPKDPDLEDAPVAPEIGTIELKAYRCQALCITGPSSSRPLDDLHWGRISECSKKAGWHHVAYVPSVESYFPWSPFRFLLIDPSSTGDEIPVAKPSHRVTVEYLDSSKGPPYASIKVFYRPRGKPVVLCRSSYPYIVQSY